MKQNAKKSSLIFRPGTRAGTLGSAPEGIRRYGPTSVSQSYRREPKFAPRYRTFPGIGFHGATV